MKKEITYIIRIFSDFFTLLWGTCDLGIPYSDGGSSSLRSWTGGDEPYMLCTYHYCFTDSIPLCIA